MGAQNSTQRPTLFHETLSGCRGHWVGVSRARMTTLINLVQELSPIVSQNCKILCGP